MKTLFSIFLSLIIAANVTACGHKGKLKTPTEVRNAEEKKKRKAEGKEAPELPTPPTAAQSTPPEGVAVPQDRGSAPSVLTPAGAVPTAKP